MNTNSPNTPENSEEARLRAGLAAIFQQKKQKNSPQASTTNTQEVSNNTIKGMNAFMSLITTDPRHGENAEKAGSVIKILSIAGLLRNPSVIRKANLDKKNLNDIVRAVFSKSLNRNVSTSELSTLINVSQQQWSGKNLIYYYALGCTDETPRNEIAQKLDQFTSETKRLKELSEYEDLPQISSLLRRISTGKITTQQMMDSIEALQDNPTQIIKFDEAVIQQMLKEVEENELKEDKAVEEIVEDVIEKKEVEDDIIKEESTKIPVIPTQPAPPVSTTIPEDAETIDYEAYTKETANAYTLESFKNLLKLCINPDETKSYFGDKDFQTIVDKIDNLDDESKELGHSLVISASKNENLADLVAEVAKIYGLESDPEGLQTKMQELNDSINNAFKIDINETYKQLTETKEGAYQAYFLRYLHGALASTSKEFTQHYQNQFFDGKNQDTVIKELSSQLDSTLGEKIIMTAKSKNNPSALFEAIITHYGADKDSNLAKIKIKEVYTIMKKLFSSLPIKD